MLILMFVTFRKEPVLPWEELVDPKKKHLATDDAIDLVDKLLKYDHQVPKLWYVDNLDFISRRGSHAKRH